MWLWHPLETAAHESGDPVQKEELLSDILGAMIKYHMLVVVLKKQPRSEFVN